jgi:hypothetical protein
MATSASQSAGTFYSLFQSSHEKVTIWVCTDPSVIKDLVAQVGDIKSLVAKAKKAKTLSNYRTVRSARGLENILREIHGRGIKGSILYTSSKKPMQFFEDILTAKQHVH